MILIPTEQMQSVINSIYENAYDAETGKYHIVDFAYFYGYRSWFGNNWGSFETTDSSGYMDKDGNFWVSCSYYRIVNGSFSGYWNFDTNVYVSKVYISFSNSTITFQNGRVQDFSGFFIATQGQSENALYPAFDNFKGVVACSKDNDTKLIFITNLPLRDPYSIVIALPEGEYSHQELTDALQDSIGENYPDIIYPDAPTSTGFSKLYRGGEKVQKLYYGGIPVKRVYYRGEIVFESG